MTDDYGTSGGIEPTSVLMEHLAVEAERGYDTLPPDIPLTEEELNDPLLQPLPPPEPLMMVGDDCWDLVSNKQSYRFENMGEMFLWLQQNHQELTAITLFHRRRGDFI